VSLSIVDAKITVDATGQDTNFIEWIEVKLEPRTPNHT